MEELIETKNKIERDLNFKVAPFDPLKRKTNPHRHKKYFEVVFFSKAEGFHYIDDRTYEIDGSTFFFIKKGAVHYWDLKPNPQGFVLIFKDSFMEETLDKDLNLLILQLHSIYVEACQDSFLVESLFSLLEREVNKGFVENRKVAESILKTILLHICSFKDPEKLKTSEKFLQLLETHPVNNVQFYANILNLNTKDLNQLCKDNFSKSSSSVIKDYLNNESKRLLKYTSITISEIAYQLHFKDVSHFVKFFKRYNSITPLNYRRKIK